MITVTQNRTNKVVLNVQSNYPNFLIKFTNPFDCTTFTALFVPTVSSTYYIINLIEVGSGATSHVNGRVSLSPSGAYELEIYSQTSTTNLNVASANQTIGEDTLIVINSEEC
jgi:hypothetical protein